MKTIELASGKNILSARIPEGWTGDILETSYDSEDIALEDSTKRALSCPIGSLKLGEIVESGETVCIVISDITRSWQRTDLYLPVIVEELENSGIKPEDISFLCALGTHRSSTEEEKKKLLGSLYGRYRFVDHDCDDYSRLTVLGKTSRGTEVEINSLALQADRLVLTGGIVFHLMAGYSAGRKSLLPGISSRKTIMQNHALSLSPEVGKGSHPLIGCAKLDNNLLHEDLMEAQEMLPPDFIVNILPGKKGPGGVVAGHYLKAHEEGCLRLRNSFMIGIDKRRDLVIASAGGFPGDINFYQSVKSLINACEAVKEGGTVILVSQCREGLGNPLMEEMITRFSSMLERELFLRDNYTIGRFIAYYGCEMASHIKVLLVTEMDEPALKNAGIISFSELQEAIDFTEEMYSHKTLSCWFIPDAAHTFPNSGE